MPEQDDEDTITLGREDASTEDGPNLGPDGRDRDLMDGSWEQRDYAGRVKQRDWGRVQLGLALLVLLAIVIPGVLVFTK